MKNRFNLIRILALILIVLKCFGLINWSWWLVLAPIWLAWIVQVLLALIVSIVFILKNKII